MAESVGNQWSAKMITIDLLSCSAGMLARRYILASCTNMANIKVFTGPGHIDKGHNSCFDRYLLASLPPFTSNLHKMYVGSKVNVAITKLLRLNKA